MGGSVGGSGGGSVAGDVFGIGTESKVHHEDRIGVGFEALGMSILEAIVSGFKAFFLEPFQEPPSIMDLGKCNKKGFGTTVHQDMDGYAQRAFWVRSRRRSVSMWMVMRRGCFG
jgi:hypothetical protein